MVIFFENRKIMKKYSELKNGRDFFVYYLDDKKEYKIQNKKKKLLEFWNFFLKFGSRWKIKSSILQRRRFFSLNKRNSLELIS